MTVPVLNALFSSVHGLKLTIRTTVPAEWLAKRILGPFDYVRQSDFGMEMADSRQVLPNESFAVYSRIHANWSGKVAEATEQLAALRPTLLLSNITYLSLAAARRLKVPAIAFGSLNWADIFHHYCIHFHGARTIWAQIVESYAASDIFLQAVPFMTMPSIHNGRAVGPVASIGRDQKLQFCRNLKLAADSTLVLIALRGTPKNISFPKWPRFNGMHILAGSGHEIIHSDVVSTALLECPFIDLVRSCDVLITKPGYGLITEAACNGTPVLLLPWEDWPETLGLTSWLSRNGRTLTLTDQKFCDGDFVNEALGVLAIRPPPVPTPSGVAEVAEVIAAYLS